MNPRFTFLITLLFITNAQGASQVGAERKYRTIRLLKPGSSKEFFMLFAGTTRENFLRMIYTKSGNQTPKTFCIKNAAEIIALPDIFTDEFFQQHFPDGQTITAEIIEYEPAARRKSTLGFNC